MAYVATKRRAENKSYQIKYKALKELEKVFIKPFEAPQRNVKIKILS